MPNLFADLISSREWLNLLLILVRAFVILLVAWLLAHFLRGRLLQMGARRRMNVNVAALIANLIQVGLIVLAILVILPSFGVDWTTLAAVAGVAGLAVSLAFQDLLRNFIAGIYILIERPFTLGDDITIQSGPEIRGTVQTIAMRVTTIRTEEGQIVVVPNNTIFTTPLTNHSAAALQRDVIRVSMADTDLQAARTRINEVLRQFPAIADSPAAAITVEEASPTVLKLRVEFWTPPQQEAQLVAQVVTALRQGFPSAEVTVVA
jgi:small-conductance mechanosensitive channel